MSTDTPAMAFIMALSALESRLAKRIDQQLSIHGISYTEFIVMFHLQKAHAMTLRRTDLAAAVSLSPSGVTRMLRPMEKIGLVEKEINPRDARVSLVRLSSGGQQIYADALDSFKHGSASLVQALDKQQLEQGLELIGMIR